MSDLPAPAPQPGMTAGQGGLRELSPAYFGLVMATGIVSLAGGPASSRTSTARLRAFT